MKIYKYSKAVLKRIFFPFLFYLMIIVQSNLVFCQEIKYPDQSDKNNKNIDSLNTVPDSIDTEIELNAKSFNLDNINGKNAFEDTILNDEFMYFNLLDASNGDIVDKGYLGSGAMVLGKINANPGFDLGYHQYDLYEKKMEHFRWYDSNVPFASLFFSPGPEVNQFWTKALFAKNFKDISVNIDYSRMIFSGKYQGQDIKHSGLNVGFWKQSKNKRFNTFFNFISNIHQEEDNGGIQDTSYLSNSNYSIREVIPVNLKDANTRKQDYSLVLNEYYRLSSNDILGIKPYLYGKISGAEGFYKFYDKDVSSVTDTMIYGYLAVDDIGLRNYIQYNKAGLALGFWGIRKNNVNFHLGMDYQNINFNIEPLNDSKTTQIFTYFKGNFSLFDDKISMKWKTKYFFYDFAGDYLFKASLKYKNSYFSVDGGIKAKNASPALKYQMLYLTKKEVYTNSFDKTSSFKVFASFEIDKIGLFAKIEQSALQNYLYFDKKLFPQQLKNPVKIVMISLKEKIKLSIFNLHLQGNLYDANTNAIPLPKYTLKAKFFISPYLYNKHLFIKTGFEFNYWDKYYNYGYNPAISSFYVQNNDVFDKYMRLDYFVGAKVKSFLIFVRLNNVLFPFDKKVAFKVIDHPQYDMLYRLGVKWTLLN